MTARTIPAAILLVVVAATSTHAAAADKPSCRPPQCRDIRVPLPRAVKVPDNRVRVIIPLDYTGSRARYPVVYVFNGVGDTYATWSEMTDVVRFARRFRVILVMPDGGKGSDAGWCSDWKDSSRQWETFHTKVLIPYIDRTYRTLGAGHRGAFGISMGGFCAMSYAGRHRGLLRAAASFSGFLDTMYATPASGTVYHYGGSGYNGQGLGSPTENVWGSQLTDEGRWRAHNPTDLAPALKGVWLYLSSGFGTPGGPAGDDFSRPHSYVIENYLFQLNLSFTRALDDAGIRYIADFHAGYHHWPYWQRDMHNALPKLVAALAS